MKDSKNTVGEPGFFARLMRGGWIRQFIKFGMVGVLNTAISLGITYVFIFINPKLYAIGNFVGWAVSVCNSFFLNRKFVFKATDQPVLKQLLMSYASYAGSFLLGTVVLLFLVEILHVPEVLAPILKMVVTIPVNFLVNKFVVFRKKGKAADEPPQGGEDVSAAGKTES